MTSTILLDRNVQIERLIVKSEDAITGVIEKNEEFFYFAHRIESPCAAFKNLEQCLEIVTKKYGAITASARGYIDSVQDKETAEQNKSHYSESRSHMTSSKRSSQRQQESEKSKLKKEELEKQTRGITAHSEAAP